MECSRGYRQSADGNEKKEYRRKKNPEQNSDHALETAGMASHPRKLNSS
jgi:hypothetical protein